MTSVSQEFQRISHHGVRESLLELQAKAIGIPLEKVYLPSGKSGPCTNEVYEQIMGNVLAKFRAQGVQTIAFGDLFLEDLRAWREKNLAQVGMKGLFPIWMRDTTVLSRQVIAMGFKAYLTCVEGKVGPGFVGRNYDLDLLKDLPADVDPCGERGEFHSFVYEGPMFGKPLDVRVGEIVVRDSRYYADLLPREAKAIEQDVAEMIPPV